MIDSEDRKLPPPRLLVSIYSNDPIKTLFLFVSLGYFKNPRATGDLIFIYKLSEVSLISKLCLSIDIFIGYVSDADY